MGQTEWTTSLTQGGCIIELLHWSIEMREKTRSAMAVFAISSVASATILAAPAKSQQYTDHQIKLAGFITATAVCYEVREFAERKVIINLARKQLKRIDVPYDTAFSNDESSPFYKAAVDWNAKLDINCKPPKNR
jgi:hypothetical protein